MLLEGSSLGALWTVGGFVAKGGIVFSGRIFGHLYSLGYPTKFISVCIAKYHSIFLSFQAEELKSRLENENLGSEKWERYSSPPVTGNPDEITRTVAALHVILYH